MRRPKKKSAHGQRRLSEVAYQLLPESAATHDWPAPTRFPHNERREKVRSILADDFRGASKILIVTGYSALGEVVNLLARHEFLPGGSVRLLFGSEPTGQASKLSASPHEAMGEEMVDYWLARGISILQASSLLRARKALDRSDVEVRIGSAAKPVHAKVYLTEKAATLGSSNFSGPGLGRQSEANVRFEAGATGDARRFQETHWLAEGFWLLGKDFKDQLKDLLERLLRSVTWVEALGRACAAILEGDWAKKYVPPEELQQLKVPMWPHQLQGISQAMWVMENVGSVLVADATGSGKTRMGAWLLRGAYDRMVRIGQLRRAAPAVIAPPPVAPRWEDALEQARLSWRVHSHGLLSNEKAEGHDAVVRAIAGAELLAVDEAHNFLNPSDRTRRLLAHYADHAVLFTATPINKGASDVLALVELLGADNLTPEAKLVLSALWRVRRGGPVGGHDRELDQIRHEIQRFMVRRTRSDLNAIVDAAPNEYRLPTGRVARYPAQESKYYPVKGDAKDRRLAREIGDLADQLSGVARIGKTLRLSRALQIEGISDESYLQRVVRSARGLARHFVLDSLRSSRAALVEHIWGTQAAWERFGDGGTAPSKKSTGNTIATLKALAGRPPEWALRSLKPGHPDAPSWLWDVEAHRRRCEEEITLYERIGALVSGMGPEREAAKVRHLEVESRDRLLIAFDSHVITLHLLERELLAKGLNVGVFTGRGGSSTKRRAMAILGLNTEERSFIALCSDALSEGMNLQGASCVVHLDTPTVIRTAEQRAGRVDRMDSRYDRIEIWWPDDDKEFAPRRRDLLRERFKVATKLIGANIDLPDESEADEVLDAKELTEHLQAPAALADLYDAFRPVRGMIGTDALVPERVYEQMRRTQAEVIACVGLVKSQRPWAFIAVGGLDRHAPRWVFLEDQDTPLRTDLRVVAQALHQRLEHDIETRPLDDHSQEVIDHFVQLLERRERDLLPMRRQRALELAQDVLNEYRESAHLQGDAARATVVDRVLGMFQMGTADPHPDPASLAEAWLQLIRPHHHKALEERRRRSGFWELRQLQPRLLAEPIATEALLRAFGAVPLLPPARERVVAMIAGVPD